MVDLRLLAAGRYRLAWDESAAIPGQTEEERAWLRQIPGKYGHVYIHGPDTLGAYCRSNRLKARLLAVPGACVHQNGDREFSVTFPPEQLEKVAEVLQFRKRRVLTPEQRAAAAVRLAPHRFAPRTSERETGQSRDSRTPDG